MAENLCPGFGESWKCPTCLIARAQVVLPSLAGLPACQEGSQGGPLGRHALPGRSACPSRLGSPGPDPSPAASGQRPSGGVPAAGARPEASRRRSSLKPGLKPQHYVLIALFAHLPAADARLPSQHVSSGPGDRSLGQETQRLWAGEPGGLSCAGRGVCPPTPAVERGLSSVGVSNPHQLTRTLGVHLRRMERFRKLTGNTRAHHVSQGADISLG